MRPPTAQALPPAFWSLMILDLLSDSYSKSKISSGAALGLAVRAISTSRASASSRMPRRHRVFRIDPEYSSVPR